ncbi:MAG: ABC transporter permease [Candidatus Riflebacteria bacterium]|nr:ABC transporter permease [Candidatus Riflebacteria bacterium]
MKSLFKCVFRELLRRKGRFLSNVFGFFLAVGIMVVMLNILFFSNAVEDSILNGTGVHFMTFLPGCTEVASLTPAEMNALIASGTIPDRCKEMCKECLGCNKKPFDLKNEGFIANGVITKIIPFSVASEVIKFPELFKDVSPYLLFRIKDSSDGHLFTVGGFDPSNKQVVGTTCCANGDLTSGSFINPGDSGVALLEEGYAKARNLKVGYSFIKLSGETFPVIGIVNPGVRPAKADVYISFKDAERVINRRIRSPLFQEMNILLIEVASALKQDAAIEKIKEILKSGLVTSYACYRPASEVIGISARSAGLVTLALGLSAIFLSMKSQYTSVIERRHEIAVLKAIGWTNANIVIQILTEAILQALIGGLTGCLAGVLFIYFVPVKIILGVQTVIEPSISPMVLLAGILLAMAGGSIAGFFPALHASRQSPAEALRRI